MTIPRESEKHIPVMAGEVIECLSPRSGESYLDATAGYGGHAAEVLARTKRPDKAVLVDRDEGAAEYLKLHFESRKAEVRNQDFLSASRALLEQGRKFDMILADLGVSSPQLEEAERGFSIKHAGKLDMRMDRRQETDAMTIVNTWTEDKLAKILKEYGEERAAGKIARNIVRSRPIKTTEQLVACLEKIRPRRGKIHPATKSFQAIRIAVNDEMRQLEDSLPIWLKLLNSSGRLAIISFHSLEDRIVKQFFSEHGKSRYDAELEILTKKPLAPSRNETVLNPRARSAKLRACRKK